MEKNNWISHSFYKINYCSSENVQSNSGQRIYTRAVSLKTVRIGRIACVLWWSIKQIKMNDECAPLKRYTRFIFHHCKSQKETRSKHALIEKQMLK